MLLPLLTDY
ncbi:Protein of unknown function [Bacillus mycoides]|uniref:Uncharacterized protein n=1 Tax=Bacillus mycoides TaxID=1405 RepID=A0A1C3T3P2_BACMY|nr:Protein of unknown function [Bacillus mycoides]SCV24996.1 Protein of unknown function [Bacillus mycoides]